MKRLLGRFARIGNPEFHATFPPVSAFRFCLLLLPVFVSACSDTSPRTTFERFSQASQDGDWETIYNLLDTGGQARVDSLVKALIITGPLDPSTASSLLEAAAADRFAALADDTPELYREFDFAGFALIDEKITGDRAILTIRLVRGQEQQVKLVRMRRENGQWRVGL